MSTTIDQKVVEMKFDNKQFENNIQTSLSSIDKLKKSLNMEGAAKGLENIEKVSGNVNMSGLTGAVENVKSKFSAMEVMAITALANITNSAVNAGKRIASALTIDPIKSGFQEYETQINAVQTILANTSSKGTTLDQVNAALDELNTYADKTIYNFTEMTRNIGTFTAAGFDLDTSVSAIKGIANLAAVSGSNSQQASTAMYQLSQALASGTVKLQDWNSVVNAGMGGAVFQDSLKETARVHGIAIDQMITDEGSFRETLKNGWLTSDILTETLAKYTGDLNEDQLRTMGYSEEQIASIIKMGQTANDAATKVKTFTQLFDTLKEAAQSGWTQSWEIIVGDFDEAKELLTEMSDTFGAIIGASADARNSMLQGWKDLGGRTALIEAARNAFEGVLSIIKPVKEAFREIFPPMTAQQLFNITEGLKNLTAHLKLSETTSDNLKRTFKGLFAVIDIVKQAFVAVIKAVIPVTDGVGGLADSILGVTASWGDWLVGLDEMIKKTDIFNKVLQGLVGFIKTGLSVVTDIFNKVTGAVKTFATAIKEKFDLGGFEIVHSVLERVHTRMSQVGEAADGMKSGFEIAVSAMGDALANSKFLQLMKALWDGVKTIGAGIAKAMGVLVDGFVEDVSNMNFDGLIDIISGLSIGGIALGINKFLKSITQPLEGLQGMIDGVTGILDGVRGCFEAYQTQLKAGTLLKIAGAIAILTASIVVLSIIDSAKLATAIAALTGLFAELMTSMAIFTKISGNVKGATKTVTAMIGMSVAILLLTSAMKKLAELDWNGIAKGMVGVAGLSAILVATSKAMSKDSGKVMKGATSLVIFAAAIKVLASACADMARLSWGEMAKGLVGVGVLMAEVSLFLNNTKFSGKAMTTATGILILSAALKVLASVCKDFGSMDWGSIGKGLTSIGVLLGEIAIFTNLTGNAKHVISTGVALVAIAGAMKIMASAMKDFGSMQWDEIGRGLTAMAGALAEITLAVNLMPKNMISTGTGLLIVAGAITVIASALKTLGGFSWEQIGKGLVVLGGALAELAIGLNLMNGTLAGSAALLVASAALAILTPVLSVLGAMSWESIAKGLVALAGAFAVIGVAGLVLTPIVPAILALSAAFALIGVGVTAVGAGLLAAGLGLQALAVGFTALAAAGAAGATAIVAALTVIIVGVADLIPVVVGKLGEGIVAFCEALILAAPTICEAFVVVVTAVVAALVATIPLVVDGVFQLLTSILTTLAEYTPTIVQAVFDVLIACLQGVANNISMVVQTAIDVIIGFLDGISQKIPDVIQAGFDMLLSFINGITNAINTNTPLLVEAMKGLVLALVKAGITVLTGGVSLFKEAGSLIMNSGLVQGIKDKLSAIKNAVGDLIRGAKEAITNKFSEFKDIGKNLIGGFVQGVKDKAGALVDSVKGAVSGAIDKAKNLLGIHSPSKVFAQFGKYTDEGFIKGIKAYSGKVANATGDMASGAIDAMSDTLSSLADTVDSGFDSQPTIKPVLDLSNIQNGASQIFSLMKNVDGYALSGSVNLANQTQKSINDARSASSSKDTALDNLNKAINDLAGNSGNSFENTFHITGNNPKEIAEEVSNIIQRQVERRDASWA